MRNVQISYSYYKRLCVTINYVDLNFLEVFRHSPCVCGCFGFTKATVHSFLSGQFFRFGTLR